MAFLTLFCFFLITACFSSSLPFSEERQTFFIEEALKEKIDIPPEDETGRTPTLNHYGSVFRTISPLAKDFVAHVTARGMQSKNVVEIMGFYGQIALKCIEGGCERYILNDADPRHLKALINNLYRKKMLHLVQKIHFLPGIFPEDVQLPKEFVHVGLLHRLHFYTPCQIPALLKALWDVTAPGGVWYIACISPYCRIYKGFRSVYRHNRSIRALFPGYCTNIRDYSSLKKDKKNKAAIPFHMLMMDIDELHDLFKKQGFVIDKEYKMSMPLEESDWGQGNDAVGIKVHKLKTLGTLGRITYGAF